MSGESLAFVGALARLTSPPKRRGALWAEPAASHGSVPMPLAVSLAFALTALILGLLRLLHATEPAEPPRVIMQAQLIDRVPTKAPEPKPVAPLKPEPRSETPQHPHPPIPQAPAPQPSPPTVVPLAATPTQTIETPAPMVPAPAPPQVSANTEPSNKPAVAHYENASIAVVCPVQTTPLMPRAAAKAGVTGTVKARLTIANGQVKDVAILSGPAVFHEAVKSAVLTYQCEHTPEPVTAIQEFVFDLR